MTMAEMDPNAVLAKLPEQIRPKAVPLPDEAEVNEFHDKVDEVTRLIESLREGTLPPEYVDRKIEEKQRQEEKKRQKEEDAKKKAEEEKTLTPEREAELRERAEELKRSYERKQKARAKYDEYVSEVQAKSSGTDYLKWDMWCPSDEEDELISKLTMPNTPEFKAMEKDIDDRHERQIKSRQIAERCRVKGNELFKKGQWTAAYDWYTEGLSHEKTNIALNGNAAMASIKMGCYVQAIEHADKTIRVCDFLLEKPNHPIKVKALQRLATARMALGHFKEAVTALEDAAKVEPENTEVAAQLEKARAEYEEDQKERRIKKAAEASGEPAESGPSLCKLRQLEELVKALRNTPSTEETELKPVVSPAGLGSSLPPPLKKKSTPTTPSSALKGLVALLREDDSYRVYLRQCGGLEALLAMVQRKGATKASDEELIGAIDALAAACLNERNTASAASSGMYKDLVALLDSDTVGLEVRSASALLLGNCTVGAEQRNAVSAALANSLSGTLSLLQSSDGGNSAQAASGQAALLTLLQNCAVDKHTQEAFLAAQGKSGVEKGTPLGEIAQLLSSNRPLLQERAASLLGNLLMDSTLRQHGRGGAVACTLIDGILAGSGTQQNRSVEILLPALAALSNCLLEAEAVTAVATKDKAMRRFSSLAALMGHTNQAIIARSASSMARLIRAEDGLAALLSDPVALPKLVAALEASCSALSATNPTSESQHAEVANSCSRALAIALSTGGETAVNKAVAAGCIAALVRAVGCAEAPDAIAGNAALALSDVARHTAHLPALRKGEAVPPLVTCVHKRKEKTVQKNGSIALARMAQDPVCLQQIKDLHGLEIIYQYARP